MGEPLADWAAAGCCQGRIRGPVAAASVAAAHLPCAARAAALTAAEAVPASCLAAATLPRGMAPAREDAEHGLAAACEQRRLEDADHRLKSALPSSWAPSTAVRGVATVMSATIESKDYGNLICMCFDASMLVH